MERERILYVQEYLSRYTDEQTYATLKEIQKYLAENYGMDQVSLLTIRRDIDSLEAFGCEIFKKTGAHNVRYYRMQRHGFTFNEIRFLVDSVSINKFLSTEQKQQLFRKFEGLCSQAEVRKLISRIQISEVSPRSLDLLKNLEIIHLILSKRQKINFAYGKYNTQKQVIYYQKRRELIPCRVVYSGERFYLLCQDAETKKRRVYRIDRMQDISGSGEFKKIPVFPEPDGAVVDIFEPERYEVVRLQVKRELLDDMLEQLGNYASVQKCPTHPDSVIIRARMGISFGFYRWVLKYGSDVKILSPDSVCQTFQEKLKEMLALYQSEQLDK